MKTLPRTPARYRAISTRRPRSQPLHLAVILALVSVYTDPVIPTSLRIEAAALCTEFFHGPAPALTEVTQ